MKVVITGGHFSPAYSVITELKKRGHEIVILGRRHPFEEDASESFEYLVAKRENINFFEIKTGRFRRSFSMYTFLSLLKTPEGFFQAYKLLKNVKPDLVITFGGYIGFPVSYAASFCKIPILLHEQTQNAGLASRLISKVAAKICISFKNSESTFNSTKTVFTGNPIRNEIFSNNKSINLPEGKIIFVTGGSTGSHFINILISKLLKNLLDEFVIVHQTGENKFMDFENLSKIRDSLSEDKKKKYILKKFIYPQEIGYLLDRADLIIARSGINTIFEIMAKKKLSLLIPLPHGQNNEQLDNAKLISLLGIGEYIEEENAQVSEVLSRIEKIFSNRKIYDEKMANTEPFIIKNAAEKIVDVAEKLC